MPRSTSVHHPRPVALPPRDTVTFSPDATSRPTRDSAHLRHGQSPSFAVAEQVRSHRSKLRLWAWKRGSGLPIQTLRPNGRMHGTGPADAFGAGPVISVTSGKFEAIRPIAESPGPMNCLMEVNGSTATTFARLPVPVCI